jgi:SAM-dependent methyltransferase
MNHQPITFAAFSDLLYQTTNSEPDGAAFLENTRERELAYIRQAAHRWFEIVQLIESFGPIGRCLDIGTSPLTFALKRSCPELNTLEALDFSKHFESRCRAASIKLYLPGTEWLDEIPNESFDCIVFLEVIEHLHMNPETVLKQFKQKLRPGGRLILSTPNLMCFGNRIRMLFNHKKLYHFTYPPFSPIGLHGHAHDRVYSPPEMKEYFQNTGWSSFHVGYHGIPAADNVKSFPPLKRMIHIPILAIKYLIPSTRQLMLAVATK